MLPPDNERNRNQSEDRSGKRQRWLWFVGIYLASLATFAAVVYLLRWMIVK